MKKKHIRVIFNKFETYQFRMASKKTVKLSQNINYNPHKYIILKLKRTIIKFYALKILMLNLYISGIGIIFT